MAILRNNFLRSKIVNWQLLTLISVQRRVFAYQGPLVQTQGLNGGLNLKFPEGVFLFGLLGL